MLSWERTASLTNLHCERAWVEIDESALGANVRQIRSVLSPQTALMAVVKADAYGHGAVMVAKNALRSGASCLGVATIPEGIELREAGIRAPILILGATYNREQLHNLVRWQLQPTLASPKQALVFSEALAELEENLSVHVKIDTGMSRLGVNWQEGAEFVALAQRLPHLEVASVYSHLATADSPDRATMDEQHRRFCTVLQQLQTAGMAPPRSHLANSAATLSDRATHYDLVRVGLSLYGLYPAPHLRPRVDLKPVMQVKARITQVKVLEAGTGVSYGHRFVTRQPTRIAVVSIGYADGVPRLLSNKMRVLLRGQFVQQVGAITMDQLMLDINGVPEAQPGEVVTLLGEQNGRSISADEWADTLGTISWEILCGFKHRLPRVICG